VAEEPDKLDYATPEANRNSARPIDRPIVGSIGCAVYSLLTVFTFLVLWQPCGSMRWTLPQFGALLSLIIVFSWRALAAAKSMGTPKVNGRYNDRRGGADDETPDDSC
jgi:hypothetical protein